MSKGGQTLGRISKQSSHVYILFGVPRMFGRLSIWKSFGHLWEEEKHLGAV